MIANRLPLKSIVVSGAVLLALIAAGCGGGAKEVVMDVRVENRILAPEIVTVEKGAHLTLNIQTDERGKFRVTDYNVGTDVEPGKAATITFTAFLRAASARGRVSALGAGQAWIVFQPDGEVDEIRVGQLHIQE